MSEPIKENFSRSLFTRYHLHPEHFLKAGRVIPCPLFYGDRKMPGICLEGQPERPGRAPATALCHLPPAPREMAQDSLQQDAEGSLVILVIGHPGRDAKAFWSGTLELKEKGHIFGVDDINRLHTAQLLPGGTEETGYGGFQESQAGPGQSGRVSAHL